MITSGSDYVREMVEDASARPPAVPFAGIDRLGLWGLTVQANADTCQPTSEIHSWAWKSIDRRGRRG